MELLTIAWFLIIGFTIVMYVILDGFTLGAGIIFPWISESDKDIAMSVLLPNWDGNQTWLVLAAACLYGAFPLAFGTLLPLMYLPLIAMLIALLFRGVVFEFRLKAQALGRRRADVLFFISSVIATFIQGVVVGSYVQGFDFNLVQGNYDYQWLTPFTVATGMALVFGYALLGATRLILKTEGDLRNRMYTAAQIIMPIFSLFIVLMSFWTPQLNDTYQDRWFHDGYTLNIMIFPIITVIAFIYFWVNILKRNDMLPYWCTVMMFLMCFAGLLYSTWPYIMPPTMTIWDAAAPKSTLTFTIPGAIVMLPFLLAYTGYSYYIFRGKVKDVIKY